MVKGELTPTTSVQVAAPTARYRKLTLWVESFSIQVISAELSVMFSAFKEEGEGQGPQSSMSNVILLKTFKRPPVTVMPSREGTESTPSQINDRTFIAAACGSAIANEAIFEHGAAYNNAIAPAT